MSRYSVPRLNVDWKRDMITYCIRELCPLIWLDYNPAYGQKQAWFLEQIGLLCPKVTELVVGVSLSFDDIKLHVQTTQGKEITLNRLVGRADSLERYGEYGPIQPKVRSAYLQATGKVVLRKNFAQSDINRRLIEVGYRCEYRGCDLRITGYEVDHRVPVSKGGGANYENLVIACPRCNGEKSAMDESAFLMKIESERLRARKV